MKKINNLTSKLVFSAALFFCALATQPAQAQISFDDDVDDETPGAPIDGFIGLGIAAGAWYGIRKLKAKK
jgi:hypothetical protein